MAVINEQGQKDGVCCCLSRAFCHLCKDDESLCVLNAYNTQRGKKYFFEITLIDGRH
jgi:hypothetical protein